MSTHNERVQRINGAEGRMFASHVRDAGKGTFSSQTWKASREYGESPRMRMIVALRFDDACGNGHNTFSATCDIQERRPHGRWADAGGGAAHDEIARVFPELAPLLKWHLVSTDGPMHYVSNTCYHADGEGKERQLDHARSCAVWPEATDAELMADDLPARLQARLPQLIADFRAAMESCGFQWSA